MERCDTSTGDRSTLTDRSPKFNVRIFGRGKRATAKVYATAKVEWPNGAVMPVTIEWAVIRAKTRSKTWDRDRAKSLALQTVQAGERLYGGAK